MLSMQKYNSGSCCKWYMGEVLFRMVCGCGHCIQLGSGLLNFIEIQPHIVLFIASGWTPYTWLATISWLLFSEKMKVSDHNLNIEIYMSKYELAGSVNVLKLLSCAVNHIHMIWYWDNICIIVTFALQVLSIIWWQYWQMDGHRVKSSAFPILLVDIVNFRFSLSLKAPLALSL